MVDNEAELAKQMEEARTAFFNEKPHVSTMLARLHRKTDKVNDGTCMVYFDAIQQFIAMESRGGRTPFDKLIELDRSLIKAMGNFPAIRLN